MTKRRSTPLPPSTREIRADQTSREAKNVTASENKARSDKTAWLKSLRLANEAGDEPKGEPAAPKRRKAAPRM